jgi:hypothetical protein
MFIIPGNYSAYYHKYARYINKYVVIPNLALYNKKSYA